MANCSACDQVVEQGRLVYSTNGDLVCEACAMTIRERSEKGASARTYLRGAIILFLAVGSSVFWFWLRHH